MAQYKTGTVAVTNGSTTVTGTGTAWTGNIAAGQLFTISGDHILYQVASVTSNTVLVLAAAYAGATNAAAAYAVSRGFTPLYSIPYPSYGDIETAVLFQRAVSVIETALNAATAAYSKQAPTTGFSITIPVSTTALILDPAGTLAAGTVTMPAAPTDGQRVELSTTATITALTVSANSGQTIKGAPTTLAANAGCAWRYVLPNTTWYRVQ